MHFVFFPPGRKQFYFSEQLFTIKNEINWIYAPLKLQARIIWKTIMFSKVIRNFFRVNFNKLPTEIQSLLVLLGFDNCLFQINCGTEGTEQKTTLVVYGKSKTTFIKAGKTEQSKVLINNEYKVLKELNGALNSPKAENIYIKGDWIILETQYFPLKKLESTVLDKKIFTKIIEIASLNIVEGSEYKFALQHGDCCPWNMLRNESDIILIDWEMADSFPLGYDLFTFIFQTSFLIEPSKSNIEILNINKNWIEIYFNHFNINYYTKYLNYFIDVKIHNEAKKGLNSFLYKKYILLKNDYQKFML